jgi:hypothetical protein
MENHPPLTRQPQHKNDDIYGGIEAGTSPELRGLLLDE